MTEKRLDVYLLAEPRAGFDKATLVRNLAALFKKDAPTIEKMLRKTRTLVKAGVDATTAAKYQTAIQNAGGYCEIIDHGATPAPLAPPVAAPQVISVEPQVATELPSVPEPAATKVLAADGSGAWLTRIVVGVALLGLVGLIAAVALPAYQNYAARAKNQPPVTSAENTQHTKASSGDKQQEPATGLLTNLRTYSDDKTISLTTPSSWKGERRLNPEAAIGVANLRENVYAVVLRENKTDFGGTFDLQRYSELIAQGLEKSTQEFYVQEAPRKLNIGGMAAQQAALAAKVDGIKIIYVITTLETAEHFYVIYAWTLASQFAVQHVLLKQVSESFTVH
ncbi:hypothetical protein [Cellvibrio sp. QJXJ]|uniref:hypothetical protein n=1 Tax=Cellvibrio sp. QJXJ TaxID=2964606 RepID=UPI0021C36F35|nr:hypothetical protein [Cellvibrio sp. QJXJ]UUA72528.1 hypothetical protein NNX04_19255 [Cellvibrio sp. QJXJ]